MDVIVLSMFRCNGAAAPTGRFADARGAGTIVIGETAGRAPNGAFNSNNTFIGNDAGSFVTGKGNTATGVTAGSDVTGNNNTAIGLTAGNHVFGSNNVALGNNAGSGTLAITRHRSGRML